MRAAKWLLIIASAIIVPVTVAGSFPPPPDMSPFRALWLWAWLSCIGGLSGYGIWKTGETNA